jgi:hypothetical protein
MREGVFLDLLVLSGVDGKMLSMWSKRKQVLA